MPEVFTQNDYINAGRLQHKISHLRKLIESQRMSNERLCYRLEALNMVESIIDAQPKTDVKRVRHGRWAKAADKQYCTNCRAVTKVRNAPFCWHCGARMDLRTPTEVDFDIVDSVMMGGADNG